jgi:hypothetical protein
MTGDQVPLSFNVNVGWDLLALRAGEQVRLSVTGGGTVNPSTPVPVPGDSGDTSFVVTFGAEPANPVRLTAELLDSAGGPLARDHEDVTVKATPQIQIGTNGPAPPGPPPAPATKDLVLAGPYEPINVAHVEVEVYVVDDSSLARGKKGLLPEPLRMAGTRVGTWAVVLPKKYHKPPAAKKHHYQCRVTAKGGVGGGKLFSTSTSIPSLAIEADPP